MAEGSSIEVGELLIDVTLSDEEEPASDTELAGDAVEPLKPKTSSTQLEVSVAVPTPLKASHMPTTFNSPSNDPINPILTSMLEDCPSGSALISEEPIPMKDPSLACILGNYTPSELSRVTTQAMIECISKFPALWDSRDASFTDIKYCSVLWKNIAVVINLPVKRIKQKWYKLKTGFKKEYFKSKASGIPSSFTYFKALSFLETTLMQGEPGDSKKLISSNIPATRLNGSCINSDDDDDDCMIIDDIEDTSSLGNSTACTPSTKCTKDVSETNNEHFKSGENCIPRRMNGTPAGEQPRPAFIIRPKNISELIAPPPPLHPARSSDGRASPDVVFLKEKSQPTPRKRKTPDGDALPPSFDDTEENPSSHDPVKADLETDAGKAVAKIPPVKKGASKKPKTSNGLHSNVRNDSGTGKKLVTLPGRHSEPVPSDSQSYSKPRLSSDMRPQELTDINKGFLMSLLPDVEGMTNSQFRTFKKQATALVSMVLDS